LRVVSVRKTSEGTLPPPEVYSRAGSKSSCGREFRTVSVPPFCGLASPLPAPLASLSFGPHAAARYIRLSYASSMAHLQEAVRRLQQLLPA
jgi:hypothetical protein